MPEVPVDWVLGENKIIELDVLSHRKVQANVSFSPSYFQHPSRAEIIYSTTFVAIGHMKSTDMCLFHVGCRKTKVVKYSVSAGC